MQGADDSFPGDIRKPLFLKVTCALGLEFFFLALGWFWFGCLGYLVVLLGLKHFFLKIKTSGEVANRLCKVSNGIMMCIMLVIFFTADFSKQFTDLS